MSGGGDHSNPGKARTLFSFHSSPGTTAQRWGDEELPLPSLNQPKHLQIDSRTAISYLSRDRWQSTFSTNPSLIRFAVKSEWWTMWPRIILNRTFNKDQVLNSYNVKEQKGWCDVIGALPCLWREDRTQGCLKNLIYNICTLAVLHGMRAKYNLR